MKYSSRPSLRHLGFTPPAVEAICLDDPLIDDTNCTVRLGGKSSTAPPDSLRLFVWTCGAPFCAEANATWRPSGEKTCVQSAFGSSVNREGAPPRVRSKYEMSVVP
jgi:hypothetical protein